MSRKVKIFGEDTRSKLENAINRFARNHKIIQISYSNANTYTVLHSAMVLYEE